MPLHADRSLVTITLPNTKPRPVSSEPEVLPPLRDSLRGPRFLSSPRRLALPAPAPEPLPTARSINVRLPPIGTRLVRTVGEKTCECKIVEKGIRYGGRTFGSLSAAASA